MEGDAAGRGGTAGEGASGVVGHERGAEGVGGERTGGIDGQFERLETVMLGECAGGFQDGVVLDGADQHAVTRRLPFLAGQGDALDRQVVRLGAAGGEDDLTRAGPEDRGNALAGVLEGAGGALAALVMTGRVTEPAGQPRPHGLEHFAARGGGRRVIQVDHDVTSRDDGHVVPVTGDEPDCKDEPWKKTR